MFGYFARLHGKHNLPVYPIVLFSHASPMPEPDHYTVAFCDLTVMQFHYRVVQRGLMKWRDYIRRAHPVATALMTKMGVAVEDRAPS